MPTNRRSDAAGDPSPPPIDLAQEMPFALGGATVAPAALSVASGDWSQRLEPRVMQVLVILARASPAVVGRTELNARVWGGRIVGEDAINRAVQALRRLAGEAPRGAPFAIETIPRVGYRLIAAAESGTSRNEPPQASASLSPVPPPRAHRAMRRPAIVGAASAVVAAAVWLTISRPAPATWRIAASTALDDLPPGARGAVLSPDGRRLAYRGEDAAGRGRIFVRPAVGGGVGMAVSPARLDAYGPAWSPDGSRLAFSVYALMRPCTLFVVRPGHPAASVGQCEVARHPELAWSNDGTALRFSDASGWNATQRIGEVRVADGRRAVLTSPPSDSWGDERPGSLGTATLFRRRLIGSNETWLAKDVTTGRERTVWHRDGVAGSVATPLADGSIAVAWSLAGTSGLDIVDPAGRRRSMPIGSGLVTGLSAAGDRLLLEIDHSENRLVRAVASGRPTQVLATVRGHLESPVLLPGGAIGFAVTSAGHARLWQGDVGGGLHEWGPVTGERIAAMAPSPDGRHIAARVTDRNGQSIVVFDAMGRPVWRWNPHLRALNGAVWSVDGRALTVPAIDGAGWRLLELYPFGSRPARDLGLPGFAVLQRDGPALYAVRAGETTGIRELWRLDGGERRLPIDLTLADIVNWRATREGIWLPDRSDPARPMLVLRALADGAVRRTVAAPGLIAFGAGIAADADGPLFVEDARDTPDYVLLSLAR